jgi:hypothetical protein
MYYQELQNEFYRSSRCRQKLKSQQLFGPAKADYIGSVSLAITFLTLQQECTITSISAHAKASAYSGATPVSD